MISGRIRYTALATSALIASAACIASASASVVQVSGTPKNMDTDGPKEFGRLALNGEWRTVMSLRGADLPDLEVGDLLRIRSELQVTTDQTAYHDPIEVDAKFILGNELTDDEASDGGAQGIEGSDKDTVCHDLKHHCMFVWDDTSKELADVSCEPCFLNLVIKAKPEQGGLRPGDSLIMGANDGSSGTRQNRGRINVARIRSTGQQIGETDINHPNNHNVPIQENHRELVASKRLSDFEVGSQVVVTFEADSGAAGYNALRNSTQIILAEDDQGADAMDPINDGSYLIADGEEDRGTITPFNGTNCVDSTCAIQKAGVIRRTGGAQNDLFVNVLMTAFPAYSNQGSGSVTVTDMELKTTTYEPGDRG